MQVDAVGTAQSTQAQAAIQSATDAARFTRELSDAMLRAALTQTRTSSLSSALFGGDDSSLYGGLGGATTLGGMMSSSNGLLPAILMLAGMMRQGDTQSTAVMNQLSQVVGAMEGQDEALRQRVMESDNEQWILDEISRGVFRRDPEGDIPYEAWLGVTPGLTGAEGARDAATYRRVIEQFEVATNGRYRVNKNGNNDTYCNIYAWDVTAAMGAEIPHYTDRETGAPVESSQRKGALAMTANRMFNWLKDYGSEYGWFPVTAEQAQEYADAGCPAVTVWKNPDGHGHVQIVRPSDDMGYDGERGVAVAQAGRLNFDDGYITDVFGGNALKSVMYYAHA